MSEATCACGDIQIVKPEKVAWWCVSTSEYSDDAPMRHVDHYEKGTCSVIYEEEQF